MVIKQQTHLLPFRNVLTCFMSPVLWLPGTNFSFVIVELLKYVAFEAKCMREIFVARELSRYTTLDHGNLDRSLCLIDFDDLCRSP